MQEIVRVENVSKIWKSGSVPVTAVNHVSFSIQPGTFTVIIGKSGCGKSTLLSVLAGLEAVDEGKIVIEGQVLGKSESSRAAVRRSSIGMVHQFFNLIPELTVGENLRVPFDLNGAVFDKAYVEYLSRELEIEGLRDRYPHQVSGGQQQRVAIARTLVLEPDIVLLDEPISALDVSTRLAIRRELKDLQDTLGTTMIYVTHDQEEAFALSDRIMILDQGHVSQLDTPERITSHPANEYVQNFVLDNLQAKIDSIAKYIGRRTT